MKVTANSCHSLFRECVHFVPFHRTANAAITECSQQYSVKSTVLSWDTLECLHAGTTVSEHCIRDGETQQHRLGAAQQTAQWRTQHAGLPWTEDSWYKSCSRQGSQRRTPNLPYLDCKMGDGVGWGGVGLGEKELTQAIGNFYYDSAHSIPTLTTPTGYLDGQGDSEVSVSTPICESCNALYCACWNLGATRVLSTDMRNKMAVRALLTNMTYRTSFISMGLLM
jgi:hypothetical protein